MVTLVPFGSHSIPINKSNHFFSIKKSTFSPPQISLMYIQMKLESRLCHDHHFRSFSPCCQISFPIGIGPTFRIINFTMIGLEYSNHWCKNDFHTNFGVKMIGVKIIFTPLGERRWYSPHTVIIFSWVY